MIKKITFLALCSLQLCANDLTWSAPHILSSLGEDATDPRIGIDTYGNLVAVWIENGWVLGNMQPHGSFWNGSPIYVSFNPGASSLGLVVDLSGNATAIWNQNGVIQSSILPVGGNWSLPLDLSPNSGDTPPAIVATSPQISVDSFGNLVAIWQYNDTVQVTTKRFGNPWSEPVIISYACPTSDSPQIAIGEDESIVAVWHSTVDGIDVIYSSSTHLDMPWPRYPTLISNKNIPSVHPHVAVDSQGTALAAWYKFDRSGTNYSNVRVQTAFGHTNGKWDAPKNLSAPGMKNPDTLALDIAFNQKDMAFVLWTNSYDASTFNLEGSVYNTKEWIPTIKIVSSNTNLYDQNFLISPSSYAYAAYMAQDPASQAPVIRAFKANTNNLEPNYGNIATISSGGINSYPRIDGTSVDLAHAVGAIWLNYNGTNTVVQTSNGQGSALPAPESLSVTQGSNDYGTTTEYYNTVSWTSSSPDSSSNWVIFRDGMWLKTLPITTLKFLDHNTVQNQPVTYGVALQSQDGDMSPISMVSFP